MQSYSLKEDKICEETHNTNNRSILWSTCAPTRYVNVLKQELEKRMLTFFEVTVYVLVYYNLQNASFFFKLVLKTILKRTQSCNFKMGMFLSQLPYKNKGWKRITRESCRADTDAQTRRRRRDAKCRCVCVCMISLWIKIFQYFSMYTFILTELLFWFCCRAHAKVKAST